jgi:hypothetical protein
MKGLLKMVVIFDCSKGVLGYFMIGCLPYYDYRFHGIVFSSSICLNIIVIFLACIISFWPSPTQISLSLYRFPVLQTIH